MNSSYVCLLQPERQRMIPDAGAFPFLVGLLWRQGSSSNHRIIPNPESNPESGIWALSPLDTTRGARETREISSQRRPSIHPTTDCIADQR